MGDYPDGEDKNELIRLIANQMKNAFLTWNKEVVDDRKIFDDLRELSYGKLDISKISLNLLNRESASQQEEQTEKNKQTKKICFWLIIKYSVSAEQIVTDKIIDILKWHRLELRRT